MKWGGHTLCIVRPASNQIECLLHKGLYKKVSFLIHNYKPR